MGGVKNGVVKNGVRVNFQMTAVFPAPFYPEIDSDPIFQNGEAPKAFL
jgi:hypothetical protein